MVENRRWPGIRPARKLHRRTKLAALQAAVSALILMYSLLPLYWLLRTSLISKEDLLKAPPALLPSPATAEHFARILGLDGSSHVISANFVRAFWNSAAVCLGATAAVCAIAVLAGYVFARWRFPGSRALFGLLLVTMVLPAYSVMLPLYRVMTALSLIDTGLGLGLIYVSAFMPLAVWLMRSFFLTVPIELEEAAQMDGAGRWRQLFLVLPLAAPGLISAATITFLSCWSQYAIPLVFASSKAQPVTVFLSTLVGKTSVEYGLMAAGGVLSILPPLLVAVFLNRYLVAGLMKGAGR